MYGEIIVGVNMLFNYTILSFANNMGNVQVARGRLLVASLIGAVPVVFFPSSAIAITLSFVGMTVIAFGRVFNIWRKSAIMVLIGAVFAGGILTAFQFRIDAFGSTVTVITYAIVAYLSLVFIKNKWLDVRVVRHLSELRSSSTLEIWGSNIEVDVFVDSGNSCTEPISGAPVHFVALNAVETHLPEELRQPLLTWDPTVSQSISAFPEQYHSSMRLIRLVTVQGRSWAIGFKFDRWAIDGGDTLWPGYIVLTKNDRRYPEGAGAILHMTAMESINSTQQKSSPSKREEMNSKNKINSVGVQTPAE